jgi:tetratricopeptide (TPR) repeat protein
MPETIAPLDTPAGTRRSVFLCAGLVVAAGIAAYHNSFHGPFIFDDTLAITDNPSIRSISDLGRILAPPHDAATAQGRPVLNLSLAVNYAMGGVDPAGYHYANLLIHLAAGLALLGIVRRTLLLPLMRPRFGDASLPLAAATAAVWTVHPLQTEAVTYTIQRAESLMGLFYLLTLYFYIRGVQSMAQVGWWSAAVASCLLGMGTKEVMVSAPVMVLLYDRTFVSGSFREALRRHGWVIGALAATWILLIFLVASGGGNRGGSVGFGVRTAWWAYALTQGEAILTYLKLCVWPDPLVFNYGTFWVTQALAAALWTLPVLALAAGIFVAFWRSPSVGFLGMWFLAILAPTSLIPGTTQMIVEHRMYLALAAVAAWGVVGAYSLLGRRSLWAWPFVVIAFCLVTSGRNGDYRSAEAIWRDTVRKSPLDAVSHYNLAQAIEGIGARRAEAIKEFTESLRLDPGNADAHDSLGLLLAQEERTAEALQEYRVAIQINPKDAKARNNLGNALTDLPGSLPEAIEQLTEAERLEPQHPEIHANLGHALAQLQGRMLDAVSEYEEAVRIGTDAATHTDLGALLANLPGRQEDAAAQYREAIRLDPGYARAHNNLGSLLARTPDHAREALDEFRQALRIDPAYADAHCNLGVELAGEPGGIDEAISEFRETIRLNPNQMEAHFNLGMLLADQPGKRAEAAAQFEEVLRIKPDSQDARQMLDQLRSRR